MELGARPNLGLTEDTMDNSELSIEARTALLGFIILKSEAIRALVSLVASKLNSIDADDDARKVRGKFFEIVSSKEYLELRSRCARALSRWRCKGVFGF
jgi:hypothetical protein